eukprot:gene16982-19353_t
MSYINGISAYEPSESRELYEFGTSQLSALMDTVHYFSTVSDELRIKDGSFILIICFCEYIRIVKRELLAATLLYAGATAADGERVPLVVQLIRIIGDPRLAHYKEKGCEQLALYTSLCPSIMMAFGDGLNNNHADEPHVGSSVDAPTLVCAYPGSVCDIFRKG